MNVTTTEIYYPNLFAPNFKQGYYGHFVGKPVIKLEEDYMEKLYEVVVVTKNKEVVLDTKVVSKNEESAKFDANVYDYLKSNQYSLDDVTIITTNLGAVKVSDEKSI